MDKSYIKSGLFKEELNGPKIDLISPSASPHIKSSNRLRYEAEVQVIKSKIGELEEIRSQLGLSQRKICQLLMVDPSAWTRWQKDPKKIPPHIYRSLQWYMELISKDPIWHPKNSFSPLVGKDQPPYEKDLREIEEKWEHLWHFQEKRIHKEFKLIKRFFLYFSLICGSISLLALIISII